MADQRLPTPGGDEGNWGSILNDFLQVSLSSTGQLNSNTVGTNQVVSGSLTKVKLASDVQTSLTAADNAIPSSQKGASNGVASLTGTTLTPSQIPATVVTNTEIGITSVTDSAYGATGNGTSDDSAAIQAAIDAANTAGGGIVYFPPGTYRVGTRIELKSGVSLVGAGRQYTKLRGMSGLATSVIVGLSGTAASDLEIRGLTIDADYSGAALNINGIQVTNGNRILIDDCTVTNVAKTGIVFTTSTDCRVINSRINGTGLAQASVGFGVLLSGGTGSKVHDNYFTACNGMNIGGNTNALNASAVNNVCDHSATPRTTVSGGGQQPATSGTLTVVSTAGFPANGTLTIAGIVGAITYTGLTATTFTGCAGASGTATDGGVARNGYESIGITDGCESWLIKGNRSIDSGDNGISVSANKSVVEGNIIDSPQFHGIALAGGNSSIVIGNWIRNPGSSTANSYSGIRVTDQANSIIALNRIFDDRGGSAMMRSGVRELNNSTDGTYIGNRITGPISLEYELAAASTSQLVEPRRYAAVTVSGATTVQTDVSVSRLRRISVTSGDAFTIAEPYNEFTGAAVTYVITNSSGGSLGTITWDTKFKLNSTWSSPTNGNSKAINFVFDGTNWIETAGTGGSGSGNANLETAVATFVRTSVAAGVNTDLACNALYSTSNVTRWPLPRLARVVGVSISPVSALSGGTLTAKITKNGSVQSALNTTISNGETTKTLDLGYDSGVSFAAGDNIGVLIDTDSSYAPTQNVVVLVHYTTT